MNLEHRETLAPEIPFVPLRVPSVYSVQIGPEGQVATDRSSREVRGRATPITGGCVHSVALPLGRRFSRLRSLQPRLWPGTKLLPIVGRCDKNSWQADRYRKQPQPLGAVQQRTESD
jgi:hypothetical protein